VSPWWSIADAAVFLASDLGRGVTDNILYVDAGMQIMGFDRPSVPDVEKQIVRHCDIEFLDRQQSNAVSNRLNEVYAHLRAKLDTALHRAQLKSLDKDS
jgi:hypothetical protein